MQTTNQPATKADLENLVIAGVLRRLHTSKKSGYVSRKSSGVVTGYRGAFGEGYTLLEPDFTATRFCWVTYYVKA